MEKVNYAHIEQNKLIEKSLYDKLEKLGLIPNEVRKDNIGKSDYSKHIIQPWSIWIDYELNPWDADIIKRVLRTKEEPGMSFIESRIMDYKKIKHICDERLRQLQFVKSNKEPEIFFTKLEKERYKEFVSAHAMCHTQPTIQINSSSGAGITFIVTCPKCGESQDITDYTNW